MSTHQIKFWFLRRRETGVPGDKALGAEKRTNKLNPSQIGGGGGGGGANALTTARSLHPQLSSDAMRFFDSYANICQLKYV